MRQDGALEAVGRPLLGRDLFCACYHKPVTPTRLGPLSQRGRACSPRRSRAIGPRTDMKIGAYVGGPIVVTRALDGAEPHRYITACLTFGTRTLQRLVIRPAELQFEASTSVEADDFGLRHGGNRGGISHKRALFRPPPTAPGVGMPVRTAALPILEFPTARSLCGRVDGAGIDARIARFEYLPSACCQHHRDGPAHRLEDTSRQPTHRRTSKVAPVGRFDVQGSDEAPGHIARALRGHPGLHRYEDIYKMNRADY